MPSPSSLQNKPFKQSFFPERLLAPSSFQRIRFDFAEKWGVGRWGWGSSLLPRSSGRHDAALGLRPPPCTTPRYSDPKRQEKGRLPNHTNVTTQRGRPVCSQALPMPPPMEQFVEETIIHCVRKEGH
ncbi:hypothetical protein HJG60_008866 [Phyllostomus discolor]|uniref:Uncharacterized protein n=1 Tax=Phyllostomus discolor TaxID=89673 RepID=A0A834DI80_9CHIR|nr:hypothetical protein HJG60_008866 [Phyllostomus discolor]